MILYCYGSNLCIERMRQRCPRAKPLGKFWLRSSRLVFRGVADCVYEPGARCPGALYKITTECEHTLDRLEGINSGSYRKEIIDLNGFPGEQQLMLYVMNSTGIMPPAEIYLQWMRRGYRDFGLPLRYLNTALRQSWDDKAPSHRERQRYMRDGRPRLATIPAREEPGRSNTGNLIRPTLRSV